MSSNLSLLAFRRAFGQLRFTLPLTLLASTLYSANAQLELDLGSLPTLTAGRTKAQNALWIETPLTAQFKTSKRVVVADLPGPATVTMLHFAYGQSQISGENKRLNRDLALKIYWDDEKEPSVDVPLVDFFCNPAGTRDEVNTALVNVRRGYNSYFPMPFRKSGRIELVYDGPVEPGEELWKLMPCYFYLIYRTQKEIPASQGYFHASWRQQGLLLGKEDYVALEAKGHGKFVGWNVSIRLPGRDGYPVDANEKFYIDGEEAPSIEFQGLEDSFGFSWGFPETESQFPYTGYYRFLKGAMAYRFFLQDSISFEKSLRVAIGFGVNEDPMFRREFSKKGNTLQFSSTVYWYQTEPHAPIPPLPAVTDRAPAPEEAFWPEKETLPNAADLRKRGVKLEVLCGRKAGEVVFAEPGFGATPKGGYAWEGWAFPTYHARADAKAFEVELSVPKEAQGTVRIFVIDPDNFEGGRKQRVSVDGLDWGVTDQFQEGKWLERQIGAAETADGRVTVRASNEKTNSNAVISIVEWVENQR